MKNIQRYLGGNLLLLVGYTIFLKVTTAYDPQGLGYVIMMMLCVGGQTVINFILSMVQFSRGDRENGKTLLLSAGVVLVVGFSACLGGGAISLK